MGNEAANNILIELKRITKLLSLIALKELKQIEQIEKLTNIGFQPKEIAELLDTTQNTVNVALSRIRKKTKGKKG